MRQIVNARRAFILCIASVLASTGLHINRALGAGWNWSDAEAGAQVLTHGPVHEAFAGVVTFNPEPGLIVLSAPPPPIEELPPEHRPEGDNVTWIPGYSAWDDEQGDYLWVSGTWRALPPGRQWIAGYWGRSGQGFQWTSGYWANANLTEVRYLPEPPETIEIGPSVQPPSPDHSWIPGCWVWHQTRYAWRPGYWMPVQPDWVWVPAYYVYAPRGYVFVNGYWDYSVSRRGVLFAPVYFDTNVYAREGFSYSPVVAIDLAVFSEHLFVRPSYHHYYFGDYYAPRYRSSGFYASFSFSSSRYGYDPLYAHQRWEHRQDRDWDRRTAANFQHRRDNVDARPPRTLALQMTRDTSRADPRDRSRVIATPLDRLTRSTDARVRFQAVGMEERRSIAQRGQVVNRFREERHMLETRATSSSVDAPLRRAAPVRVTLPRSPIVARPVNQLDRGQAPPRRPQVPRRDLTIEPKPRMTVRRVEPSSREPRVRGEPVNRPRGDADEVRGADRPRDR